MIKKILLAFVLFIFIQSAHSKIYNSEASDCLQREEINGTLNVHLNSTQSGVFSHTNECWWQAAGDIKFQSYGGALFAIARWVPLAYIDFNDDYEQLPLPSWITIESWNSAFYVFAYYQELRNNYCNVTGSICSELKQYPPMKNMPVKQIKGLTNYYECYITDTNYYYPTLSDVNCRLVKGYYFDDDTIKPCFINPSHPDCQNDYDDSNNNSNNNNSENNNNNVNSDNNNNNVNSDNNSGNNNDVNDALHSINDKLLTISKSLNASNDNVSKIANNTEDIVDSVNSIDFALATIANNTLDIIASIDDLSDEQKRTNDTLDDISRIESGLLSETKSFHFDANKNHDELMNRLGSISSSDGVNNNGGNNSIGDFTDSDANSLNNKFNESSDNYNDDSISYVESALSKLSNSIPDLSLMFKLPNSFYGGNNGMCKPLSTNLNFKFPFSSQKFLLKFDTSNFCQHYDKNFRGIVDFLFSFMTALAIFRLYHRYNS